MLVVNAVAVLFVAPFGLPISMETIFLLPLLLLPES
jgi:hypothetical protein